MKAKVAKTLQARRLPLLLMLAAAVSISYIAFLIPSLSYNSIACFGLLSGMVFIAWALLPGPRLVRLCLGTALLSLAAFAYPPILLAALSGLVLGLVGVWRVAEPEQRWRALGVVAITGTACVTAGLMVIARNGGLDEVARVVELSRSLGVQGGGVVKLRVMALASSLPTAEAVPSLIEAV